MIVAAIPARSGSKGIKDKNICHVDGLPLLAWSIRTALDVKTIDKVVVSTDSFLYAAIARTYGVTVPWIRSAEFAQDHSDDYGWIHQMIMGEQLKPGDLIVHLRPTTPLRVAGLIDSGLLWFEVHPKATSMRSVEEMSETAYKAVRVSGGFCLPLADDPAFSEFNLPRQCFPPTYHPNGYIDILRVSHILEHQELYGNKILAFETPRVTEVDTEEDLERVRWEAESKGAK